MTLSLQGITNEPFCISCVLLVNSYNNYYPSTTIYSLSHIQAMSDFDSQNAYQQKGDGVFVHPHPLPPLNPTHH